jgi:hypothetical protein
VEVSALTPAVSRGQLLQIRMAAVLLDGHSIHHQSSPARAAGPRSMAVTLGVSRTFRDRRPSTPIVG